MKRFVRQSTQPTLHKSEKKELVEMVDLMREAIQLRLALGMGSYA